MIEVTDTVQTLKCALNACVIINPKCFSTNCQDILEKKPSALEKLLKILMFSFLEQYTQSLSESQLFEFASHAIGNSFESCFEDIQDGLFFIKLIEAIQGPNSVDWGSIDFDNREENIR